MNSIDSTLNLKHDSNPIVLEDMERIIAANLPWTLLKNKTIVVTGGSGYLASYLIKALLAISRRYELHVKVICVARNAKSVELRLGSYVGAPDFSVVKHDVSMPLPNDFPRADIVVHSASQASPKYYGTDPVGTLLTNTVGTMHLLEYAEKSKTEKFLFFSSGEIYGVPIDSTRAIGEQDFGHLDPMNVRSCYAESKRMGETMCSAWTQQYGLHTNVVRPFHTYGPGMALDDGRVFADFVSDVVAKRDIVLKSDGIALRPFCYIADATIGFLTVLLIGGKAQAYNIANPGAEISIRNLAKLIAELFPERKINTRYEAPVQSNVYLQSPVSRACPSIEKIQSLGWSPVTGLVDGFSRTIKSFLV